MQQENGPWGRFGLLGLVCGAYCLRFTVDGVVWGIRVCSGGEGDATAVAFLF